MGFFGGGRQSDSENVVRTALVVEAVAPPEGGPGLGPGSHAPVRILADAGSGPRVFEDKVRMAEGHWLVPGMEVEVTLNRDRPDWLT
jgi:hypothetical protein